MIFILSLFILAHMCSDTVALHTLRYSLFRLLSSECSLLPACYSPFIFFHILRYSDYLCAYNLHEYAYCKVQAWT